MHQRTVRIRTFTCLLAISRGNLICRTSALLFHLQLDLRPSGKIIMQIKLYGTLTVPGKKALSSYSNIIMKTGILHNYQRPIIM